MLHGQWVIGRFQLDGRPHPDGLGMLGCAAWRAVRLVVDTGLHARGRLGAAWDIRDFHAAVLDHGTLPLPVLSQVVEAWVTSAAAV